MTANALAGDRAECLAAGMDDHVAKPFKKEALGATLAQWLQPAGSETEQTSGTEPPAAGEAH
jgi:CheY-like chemotaxis protein